MREGDDASKAAARRVLGNLAWNPRNAVLIAEAGGIPPLVDFLRDGSAEAKVQAAWALRNLTWDANKVLIAEAGGIPPLVDLVRDGSAEASAYAAHALRNLALSDAANKVLIAEAGGIPPLVDLVRDGSAEAKEIAAAALCNLSRNNANAIAIALTVGFDALVELARDGHVHVDSRYVVSPQLSGARREAALLVLRRCLPREIPDDIVKAIAAALA